MTISGTRKSAADLIRESDLDPEAVRVVGRLTRSDHEAYLVGGCVRDLLISKRPKDFDVATSASPQQVRRLFSNCRLIGRRFRLAHVAFGEKIIEVSTFRQTPEPSGDDGDHLIVRDNIFGTAEQDALRRDFTINALFYDVERAEILDHVQGMEDIEGRLIRTIGDPAVRIQEDPVRIIRAARLKAQVGFSLDASLLEAMKTYADHIQKSAPARVQEEIFKILECGCSQEAMRILIDVGCFAQIYPTLGVDAAAPEKEQEARAEEDPSIEPEDRILDWDAHAPGVGELRPELELETTTPPPSPDSKALLARLAALDHVTRERGRPSRAVLLAILILDRIRAEEDQRDLSRTTWGFLAPFRTNNRISRRDAEVCSKVIAFQRRLFGDSGGRRGRSRPEHIIRNGYFPEALALAWVDSQATGVGKEDVARWEERMKEDGMDPLAVYQKAPVVAGRPGARAGRGRPDDRPRRGQRRGSPERGGRSRDSRPGPREARSRGERGNGSPPAPPTEPMEKERPKPMEQEKSGERASPGPRPERSKGEGTGGRPSGDGRPAPYFKVTRPSKPEPKAAAPKSTRRARGWIRLTKGQRPKRKRVPRKRV
ncbi:MAG: hypothetical protein O6952_02165 [Planctomycetota bacterium]|nr:hypothetical protein [Planctomycetota bacterium]